ncbi:MAG: glycosyltransferase family 39 protein [Chloroflexi bacterium]|nr:glycosyltransferase family 39 protein [Chloroflexota bacterium]
MLQKLGNFSQPRKILIAILMIAFGLRIVGIFWGLPIFDTYAHAYHPDESKIINGAVAFPEDIFEREDLRYPTGLHYFVGLLVIPLGTLATFEVITKAQLSIYTFIISRIVSVVFGVGAVALTYRLGKLISNTTTGLLASSLLSVSLYHARHSAIATTDVATSFWIMAVLISLYRLSLDSKTRDYLVLGIFSGLLIGTKYSGVVVIASAAVIFIKLLRTSRDSQQRWRLLKGGGISTLSAITTFLMTTPSILVHPQSLLTSLQYETSRVGYSRAPLWNINILVGDYKLLVMTAGLPIAILVIFGLINGLSRSEIKTNLPLLASIIAYLLFFWGSLIARYYILLLPILCLLAAKALDSLLQRNIQPIKLAVVLVFSSTLLYSLVYSINGIALFLNDSRSGAAAYIDANLPAGASIGYAKTGNLQRWGWRLPFIDPEKYTLVDNLTNPDYLVLSGFTISEFESAFASGRLSEDYVWDVNFPNDWWSGEIPDPQVFEFFDYFLNGVGDKYSYELLAVFKREITVPVEMPPPEIRIYQRID